MASSVELLRILIQDPSPGVISDEDLGMIVDLEENAYRAASTACRTLAAYYAKQIDTTFGPDSVKLGQRTKHYEDLAKSYDSRAATGGDGGTGVAGVPISGDPVLTGDSHADIDAARDDTDRYNSTFYRDMTSPDNAEGYDE